MTAGGNNAMADHSKILPVCGPIAHFLEFFCLHGAPLNKDAARPVSVIVNHGFAVGYSPKRMQPVWAAYQVSAATRDVDYERPKFFYDDPRLPKNQQIGTETFQSAGPLKYDRGHMVPNYAINTQFGRVAQSETFFMSNILPQASDTNRGAWQKLEKAIIRAYAPLRKQVWAMVGPIFGKRSEMITRPNGLKVPVPDGFFLILADPERYPYDDPNNINILALHMPQDWGHKPLDDTLVTSLDFIERSTGLTFFPRLSPKDKAKLANQTSPVLWPLEAIAASPNDPQP
jgi:endonuclease G